ncbi:MAG: PDZ domain-containing protein [Cyclobacteriaceae bacterium]
MLRAIFITISFVLPFVISAQTHYEISFENAVHHEAQITVTFDNLPEEPLLVRMSRTSPGRYAIHDFAKNVYDVKAVNGKGKALKIERQNPQVWHIEKHDGKVKFSYKLFADRADGTYSQIDQSHAHLNMPATFVYAENMTDKPHTVKFNTAKYPKWKVATQLREDLGKIYFAPDLQYFMDSPTEISDFYMREFIETSNGKDYTIRLVVHHEGDSKALLDKYFEWVKKIVKEEKKVFGELPDFDFGKYTFLACYRSNASGDGMEHRNSTILTSSRGLTQGEGRGQIGTVSHEFFHAWNVERIRPASLEPFSFEDANMSGELWFAEGFTSYYTNLILCRAGIITPEQYISRLSNGLNYVWNSPARQYFTPIEMSYQAPFVDAATSVDPTNRRSTFISYYTYGSVLGLALDLKLRNLKKGLNLDDYMKQVWMEYGKPEKPYTVQDLQEGLAEYAGKKFATSFFRDYIYNSSQPDYQKLLASVGVDYKPANAGKLTTGLSLSKRRGDKAGLIVQTYPVTNSPGYEAGLTKNDVIISMNGSAVNSREDVTALLESLEPGSTIAVRYTRFGKERQTKLKPVNDPAMKTTLLTDEVVVDEKILNRRKQWLKSK